jgi:RNA polymerase sigma-70 factor (ECF subfamily)
MTDLSRAQRFEAIALPHLNSAFNLARWLTRSDQDAEDVVQEACLKAFRHFDGFRGGDGRTWLLAIVRNTFYTHYRLRQGEAVSETFDEDFHSLEEAPSATPQHVRSPEVALSQQQDQQRMNRALESLPLEYREVVIMRELDDLSYRQIADVIGVPIGTVMSRLSRGRKLLAQRLLLTGQEA